MTALDLDSTVRPHAEALARDVGGETLLVSLASGRYYGLDQVGSLVWRSIGCGARLADVLQRVLDEYEVDSITARDDLLGLAQELCQAGLLDADPTV